MLQYEVVVKSATYYSRHLGGDYITRVTAALGSKDVSPALGSS